MRIAAFDYIRLIAMFCIVICHICYGIGLGVEQLGRFLGQTFNCTFFALSALLLGLRWQSKGQPTYTVRQFLVPRIQRLLMSYWPVLIIVFALLYAFGEPFTIKQLVLNFAMLSWFGKLPGFEHFWFMSMLLFCYILFWQLSKKWRQSVPRWGVVAICLLLTVAQWYLDSRMKPGYAFQILMYTGFIFLYANQIMKWLDKVAIAKAFAVWLPITGASLVFHLQGGFDNYRFIAYCVAAVTGLTQLACGYVLFKRAKLNRAVSYLSAISFEVYLVHHPFCFGRYSLFNVVGDKFIVGFIVLIVSMLIGGGYPQAY